MLSDRTILFSFAVSAFLNLTTTQHLPIDVTDRPRFSHHHESSYVYAKELL